ncbi:pentatricopeptide repeat-containing family protein, partial [Striga asiatica]
MFGGTMAPYGTCPYASALTLNDDIVSWTAMINGYAEHGISREAIELFKRIPDAGLRPDSVTFIGVLGACSHAGLVGLGLEEAERMMREMSFEKEVVVWSSVLRASRECGDVERGRVAAEEWKETAGVRRLMRWRGVVKEPGWSWVKVKEEEKRVSAFVAGDRNHPRCDEVYGVLGLVYCSSEELSFEE